jgi:membrane dipeptidase
VRKYLGVALSVVAVLCLVLLFFLSAPDTPGIPEAEVKPSEAYDIALVVDTHSDTLLKITNNTNWLPLVDIGNETPFDIDIPKLRRGGVNVQYFGAFTSGYYSGGQPDYTKANSRLLSLFNALYWTIDKNPASIGLAKTVEGINNLAADGRLAAVISIEGAYSIDEKYGIELLRQYYDLGVRAAGLTWNHSNALGEGVNKAYMDGTPSKGGLTALGRKVVAEANRLGIIIDVSHMNEETFWDVMEFSNAPVIASHSGVYNLRNHVRNLKDDQIRSLAEKGGVVQVVFYPEFLAGPEAVVNVNTIVDHIDYIANLVGAEHVGIGSDFDGAPMPEDLPDASMIPKIEKELNRRGYEKSQIEKIMGKNTMRVMEDVWGRADIRKDSAAAPTIKPMLDMGQAVTGNPPVLTAVIEGDEGTSPDISGISVIVDGRVYTPKFDAQTATASLKLPEPLKEKFHVVTFRADSHSGEQARETRIFYIR